MSTTAAEAIKFDFGPPPTSSFTVDVTDKDVAFFAENGYFAAERVTTDEELQWLRKVYDTLIAQPRSGFLDGIFDLARPYGTTDEPKVGQLLVPERYVPQIRETTMWKNGRRIASRLLEVEDAKVESWGHLIFKKAHDGGETPWHQDESYWDTSKTYHALGSWLPLDDVNTENGCLWFVPGSHRGEVLPHRHKGDDPSVHILEFRDPADTSGGIPIPLKAGGMTFHHSRTWHFAGPNRTGRIRRAWANEFQTAPVKRDVPADYPWLTEGRKAHAERLAKR